MNYLTNHYKNLCEQYQSKISILENLLNEDAPASTFSGTGQGQQTFSDQQLRDQMKQNKRTGLFGAEVANDKQNQAYKDAEAELARREGKGGVNLVNTSKPGESPRVDLDPSIKQSSNVKTDRVAGDWVERYAQKLGEDPRKIEAMRRGVIDTLGGDAGKPMDTSMTSDQVAQRGVDAYNKAKEYVVGLQNQAKAAAPASTPASAPARSSTPSAAPTTAPKTKPAPKEERGLGIDVERGQFPIYPEGQEDSTYTEPSAQAPAQTGAPESAKQLAQLYAARMTGGDVFGRKYSKQPKPAKAEEDKITEIGVGGPKHTAPTYVVPESEEWGKLSPEEQVAMAQTALQREEGHKFFGGREGKKGGFLGMGGERTYRFSEDNSGQTPEETARLNRQAKMLNALLNSHDADAKASQGEMPTASPSATTAGALESSRQLAQMYANRMGRRVSKAPATPQAAVAPKEQVSSFDSAFKAYQDRSARTAAMSLAMAEKQSPKGSNMEGQALENDAMARARYAQSVKTNATQKAAEQEFVKRFGRLPNSKSAVDNTYMETLLSTKFKTKESSPAFNIDLNLLRDKKLSDPRNRDEIDFSEIKKKLSRVAKNI